MPSSLFLPYVSRVVDVTPETAGVGFDFACRCLAVNGDGATPPWTIETASGRLVLVPPVVRTRSKQHYPLRAVPGVLRPALRASGPVPVQLEVFAWSETRSELGLIALTRRWFRPTHRGRRAYLRTAHDVLDLLRRALEAPPAAWLAHLARDPGTAATSPGRERLPVPAGTGR